MSDISNTSAESTNPSYANFQRPLWFFVIGIAIYFSYQNVLSIPFYAGDEYPFGLLNRLPLGDSSFGWRLFQLIAHLACSFLLYEVVLKIVQRSKERSPVVHHLISGLVALLWSVHPVHTGVVSALSELSTVLAGLLVMASVYCFLAGNKSKTFWLWGIGSLSTYGASIACHPLGLMMPLFLLVVDRSVWGTDWSLLARKRGLFYASLLVISISVVVLCVGFGWRGLLGNNSMSHWMPTGFRSSLLSYAVRTFFLLESPVPLIDCPVVLSSMDMLAFATLVTILLVGVVLALISGRKNACWIAIGMGLIIPLGFSTEPGVGRIDSSFYLSSSYLIAVLVYRGNQLSVACSSMISRVMADTMRRNLLFWLGLPLGLLMMALTFESNLSYRREAVFWKTVVSHSPENLHAWKQLTRLNFETGNLRELIKSLREVIRLEPNSAWAYAELGGALVDAGEYAEAEKFLRLALDRDAKDQLALRNLSNLLLDTGRISEAMEACTQAIKLNPNDNDVRITYAAALIMERRNQEAIRECEEVLRSDPQSAPAHYNMATALDGLGKLDDAIHHAELACEADPNSPNAFGTLGLLLQDRDKARSKSNLIQACDLAPKNIEYPLALANILSSSEPDEALMYYESALEIQPDNPEIHMRMAYLCEKTGDREGALSHLRSVIKLAPTFQRAKDLLEELEAK